MSNRIDHVVIVLSEPLHAARGPLLNGDVIVHHSVDVRAGVAVGIAEDGLGAGVGIDEVVVHSKVVSQFMGHNLKFKSDFYFYIKTTRF